MAFCTRPQFVMTFRVSNAPFFTRNNSHLDLSRLYHTPRLVNENQECCFLPLSSFGTPEEHFLYHTVCPGIFDKQEGLRPYIFLFNKANGDHSSKYEKSYVCSRCEYIHTPVSRRPRCKAFYLCSELPGARNQCEYVLAPKRYGHIMEWSAKPQSHSILCIANLKGTICH